MTAALAWSIFIAVLCSAVWVVLAWLSSEREER